ncbi:hypothetical protein SLEP1_g56049 [Rubroshorea leprosula]|uniref:DUF6821 domain-containing protein n=1 Tax=Rubroshorea leprosula TaxID=152421 RepID=A0AAV5MIG8_9ROSI|nr:hypothetical protein SLEP1_g56049 [Rubroshorea leprosula]
MSQEMDIDGWEFLPNDGFLDLDHLHDDGQRKIFVGKRNSDSGSVFNMNYFNIESPKSSGNSRALPNQLVPVPFQLEPRVYKATDDDDMDVPVKGINKLPIDVTLVPPPEIPKKIKDPPDVVGSIETDPDAVSQVFFKKTNINEFVDMKMDSPKSSSRGILPQIDAGAFNFEDKSGEALEKNINSPRKRSESGEEAIWDESSCGFNLWKWSLNGIGAICSFGVAAATVCIIVLGSQQRNRPQQNQKLRFQIYTDDKRIKQVVHHATKLNEAISAVRGVPITRAHIRFGGYYDGL